MKLQVRHTTTYHFSPPMRGVVQSLRLWPSLTQTQTVIDWTVTCEGASEGAAFRDGAGDWIETRTMTGAVGSIRVDVSGTVKTEDSAGVLKGHSERAHPLVYLRHTRLTRPSAAIAELAASAVSGTASELENAHALAAAVKEAIVYTPNETTHVTTGAEALEHGKGVCQDHAHALIAAALSLGVPARYVTGYLHAEGDIAEASHAWTELYVNDLGWVGFDASNGVCPDEHYIRIGSGYDAVDAAPIRGVAQGEGAEALDIDVSVVEAAQ